jgi:hypothetical protein
MIAPDSAASPPGCWTQRSARPGSADDGSLDNNLGALNSTVDFCSRASATGSNDWLGPVRAHLASAFEVLHPELSGGTFYWRDGKVEQREILRAPGSVTVVTIICAVAGLCRRADQPPLALAFVGDPVPDMELVQDRSRRTGHDRLHAGFRCPMQDTSRTSTMSFATQAARVGFGDLGGGEEGLLTAAAGWPG